MGAAWCRKKAEAAEDSKSPVDRVVVRVVRQICPDRHSTDIPPPVLRTPVQNSEPKERPFVSPPLPTRMRSHVSTSSALNNSVSTNGWEDATLTVPDSSEPPVPPPRKKKLKKQQKQQISNTLEITDKMLKPRPKNLSTVSMPEYRELEKVHEDVMKKSSSSNSLSSIKVTALKQNTAAKIEEYMKRCGSFGEFNAEKLIEDLNRTEDSSDSEDFWDDWDFGTGPLADNKPPVEPHCKVTRQRKLATVDRDQQTLALNGICCMSVHEDNDDPKKNHREISIIETASEIPPPAGFENSMSVSQMFHSMAEPQSSKPSDMFESMSRQSTKPVEPLNSVAEPRLSDKNRDTVKQPLKESEKQSVEHYNSSDKCIKPSEIFQSMADPPSTLSEMFHSMTERSTKLSEISPSIVEPLPELTGKSKNIDNNNDNTINCESQTCNNICCDKVDESKLKESVEMNNTKNDKSSKIFDFSKYLRPITIFSDEKTKNVIVTKTPPPSPEVKDDITIENLMTKKTEDSTHSNLLRILREYGDEENGKITEKGAQKMLLNLGVPLSLREPENQLVPVHQERRHRRKSLTNGSESSGHSSMTPSLSELEAALSELLESGAGADDDESEDDGTCVKQGSPLSVGTPTQHIVLHSTQVSSSASKA